MITKNYNKTIFTLSIFLILIVMSRILWYDYKGILIFGKGDLTLIRYFFYLYGLLLMPVVIFWVLRLRKLKIDRISLYSLFVALYGLIIAILYQNNLNYVIGDTYKILTFVSGIYLGRKLIINNNKEKILLTIVYVGIVFALGRFLLFKSGFLTTFGFAYGVTQDLFLIFPTIILLNKKITLYRLTLLLVAFGLVVLGQKRSLFLIIFMLLPLCLFWMKNRWSNIFKLSFVLIILGTALSLTASNNSFENKFSRVSNTDWSDKLKFKDGRAEEAQMVILDINNNELFLFGKGSGAEYAKEEKLSHSIHITPLGLFFRYGFLGLCFYLYLFFKITSTVLGNCSSRKYKKDEFFILANLYILGALVMSFGIFGLIDDPLAGLCLGYVLNRNSQFKKENIKK